MFHLKFVVSLLLAINASSFILPFKVIQSQGDVVKEHSEVLTLVNSYWVTNVTIGTPAQVFQVLIDTRTSNFWVADQSCVPTQGVCASDECTGVFCSDTCPDLKCCIQISASSSCYGKTQFFSNASSTYQLNGSSFLLDDHFGIGAGFIGVDKVQLGNDDGKSVTINNAYFGQVNSIPDNLRNVSGVDGVLGLSFPALSAPGLSPIFVQAINQGATTNDVFTIWLEDQWETSDNGTEGVIYYGNNDPLHCNISQQITYPLSSAKYFQFTVPGASLGGSQFYSKPTQAIIDSSSSYISAPSSFIRSILSYLGLRLDIQLPATVPCNTKLDIAFNFPREDEHVTQLNLLLQQADGTCQLGLIESLPMGTDNGNRFEFGIPFLRGRCTYYHVGQQLIGFSDAKTHGGHT